MKIIFVSNYLNHHQKPFSNAMYEKLGPGYTFVETTPMNESRKSLGWERISLPKYVVPFEDFETSKESIIQEIDAADVVVFGTAPYELISNRIRLGKPVIRYSERPLKKGIELLKYLPRLIKWHLQYPTKKPIYMLCASAYTASDFAKFGMYKGKCYKWGYFPECKRYQDVSSLVASKKKNSLLWCGRLIDWKHPEIAVEIAKRLQNDGYSFTLDIIGAGDMDDEIQNMIRDKGLSQNVFMRGSMPPEKVREFMEQSEIYLFTSDQQEGWGVVLNESMNSACAVIANKDIGSAPFLINDGENGMLYCEDDLNGLYEKVKSLLDDPSKRADMGVCAYYTICDEWSPEIAASRLVEFVHSGLKSTHNDGPCSKAR